MWPALQLWRRQTMLTLVWLRSPSHPAGFGEGDDDEGPVAMSRGFTDDRDSEMPMTRHHTEHFSAGFMGEPFGQWKTRENSSNWDTLPITLQCEKTQCGRVSRCIFRFSQKQIQLLFFFHTTLSSNWPLECFSRTAKVSQTPLQTYLLIWTADARLLYTTPCNSTRRCMIKCFAWLTDVRVHAVPVVLRSVFISEQL